MENNRSVNSSEKVGTSGRPCSCCHNLELVKPHWDYEDILLCEPCNTLIFVFEGHGDLAHLAYAYWTNIIQAREA